MTAAQRALIIKTLTIVSRLLTFAPPVLLAALITFIFAIGEGHTLSGNDADFFAVYFGAPFAAGVVLTWIKAFIAAGE